MSLTCPTRGRNAGRVSSASHLCSAASPRFLMATVSEALESSRRLWDAHAQSDPLWAILSDPANHGGKWNLHRFFQTGLGDIPTLLYELARLVVSVKTDRSLDFGWAVPRHTQSLTERFSRAV